MQDSSLTTAIDNWEPRVIANGVDPNDYRRVVGAISRWVDWLPAWEAHGDMLAELAAVPLDDLGPFQAAAE